MIWEILIEDNAGATPAPNQERPNTHENGLEARNSQPRPHTPEYARGMHTPSRGRGDAPAPMAGTNTNGDTVRSLAAGSVSPEAEVDSRPGDPILDLARYNVIKNRIDTMPTEVGQPTRVPEPRMLKKQGIYVDMKHKPRNIGKDKWIEQLAKQYQVSKATIYRWLANQAKANEIDGRKSRYIVPFHGLEFRTDIRSEYAIEFLARVIDDPLADINWIYDQMATKYPNSLPHLRSFYRLVDQNPAPLFKLATGGRRSLEAISMAIEREWDVLDALDIIAGDQMVWDYKVIGPDGDIIQPQMYAWVDLATGNFLGVVPVLGTYDKYAVGLSLHMVCKYGVPKKIYTDWGKPERSHYIENIVSQLSGMGCELYGEDDDEYTQVRHVKAQVRRSWSKPIESYWRIWQKMMYRKTLGRGYCKRLKDDDLNEYVTRELKKTKQQEGLITWDEFFRLVREVWVEWNTHALNRRCGSRRYTIHPVKEFMDKLAQQEADGKVRRYDQSVLDLIFLPGEPRTITKCKVEINSERYYNSELLPYEHQKADVRYNPLNNGEVIVITTDNQVFRATRFGAINPFDEDAIAERLARQNREIRKWEEILESIRCATDGLENSGAYGPTIMPAKHKLQPGAKKISREREMEAKCKAVDVNSILANMYHNQCEEA